jgi:amino acid transporter
MKIRWNEVVLGPAKDPMSPGVFHKISLVALLAWIGLGADGLSSSCYGPEEAFKTLTAHHHQVLALPLAAFVAFTVIVISLSYSLLIEAFPSGGGGYVVTTKLLGKWPGVACGWALVLDYILTIAVSVSSGIDALFSFLPAEWVNLRSYAALALLLLLIILNLRGVKESILLLLPIFVVFVATHTVGILWAVGGHAGGLPQLFTEAPHELRAAAATQGGWLPLLAVFFAAYTMGAGTYTGIEAVSNSMQILREPRVATGKRTMLYMALSLSIVAAGLLIGYRLLDVSHVKGKTLNAVLFEGVFSGLGPTVGPAMVIVTLLSEGALLFVAAQAGFIGGPRTLATMALDRWVPTRFAQLSNRLVVQDGVLFMGLVAFAFVLFTGANTESLIVLYSINVFVTFTLSQLGMSLHWIRLRSTIAHWKKKLSINAGGLLLSLFILCLMVAYKFSGGGWLTLLITGLGILSSVFVHRHYEKVRRSIRELDLLLEAPPAPPGTVSPPVRAPAGPTAVLLVGGYNGLGMHSFLTILRTFPNHFRNFLFVSVGVIDYDEFKGEEELQKLQRRTVESLGKYVLWARSIGLYAEERHAVGTDLVNTIEELAQKIVAEFPGAIFFGGQLVFQRENFFTRSLHSQAAFEIQRRLQFSGRPMVLLPVRIRS